MSVTLNGSKTMSVKVDVKAEGSLKGIEHLIGGSKGDKLGGDGQANALLGGKGNDSLRGGGDADGKDGQAAVLFATLGTKPSLDHGDFAIV